MNELENKTYNSRYSHCDKFIELDDIIFLYPSYQFERNPNSIAANLQCIMNYVKNITSLDPTSFFKQRTVVGHRHPSDEINGKNCQPGWMPNWVNIPWNTLNKDNEPIDMCTHELIHPFFACSPIKDRNEGWGEGFCDFLRGPTKEVMGLDGISWWREMIKCAKNKPDSTYHHPAGKFVLKLLEEYDNSSDIANIINDKAILKTFLRHLFNNFKNKSLSDYIEPSEGMKNKWQGKNKI